MNTRRLAVKKERLSELTTDDLTLVAGAAIPTVANLCYSIKVGTCQSDFQACTTAQSCGCQPSWNCQ